MTAGSLRERLAEAPSPKQVEDFIAWVREFRGPDSLEARREAEDQARRLLNQSAGSMTREQAVELGRLLNTDSRDGEVRHDRFSPAFHGAVWERVIENQELFNQYVARIWRGTEEEALAAVSEIFDDPQALPGAGRSLPTVLLYLKKPEKYAIWLSAIDQGLNLMTGAPRFARTRGLDGYREFSERVLEFSQEHDLAPPEVDGVLALAARIARSRSAGPGAHSKPTLGKEAFEFLADLEQNNNGQWMSTNRDRYRSALSEPFRALLRDVAERYIGDLDPELNTEVKTGQVLASIRRRFPNETGEYYPYYWGAFSRGRRQEDAQLYVMVRPQQLEAGVTFGERAEEKRDRVRARAPSRADELWSRIAPSALDLVFRPGGEADDMQVRGSEDLVRCLEGPRPKIFRRWQTDDPAIGTPELADAVGKSLATLYPIAALAWEYAPIAVGDDDQIKDDVELDEYSLTDLARDTLLPPEDLEEWAAMLQGPKRQAIFYGPPGTGKTYVARALARHLAAPEGQVRIVQFHPSFSYEDFIEGLRPAGSDEDFRYEVRPGLFFDFCEEARSKIDLTFVMVIDEINRADLGSVLGELLMLLEYRGDRIHLPYSKRHFSIPKNVVVLATMNTADRSLALLDFALRRRFHTIALPPSREVLARYLTDNEDADLALHLFDLIQSKVANPDVAPGHTYFMADDVSSDGLRRIWRYELRPYLAEFWFEQGVRLQDLERAVGELLAEGT